MAKRDKEFEARMQGMIYALNKVREEGIEGLERDMKKRNLLKLPLNVTEKKMHEYFGIISKNLYNNALTSVAYTLHNDYGFGMKRISEFKKAFDKNVQATLDLDYLGGHYVRLEDFAIEMNEKFNLGIDINRVASCQEVYDNGEEKYKMCNVEKVIQELRENGFKDAAVFIEDKLY